MADHTFTISAEIVRKPDDPSWTIILVTRDEDGGVFSFKELQTGYSDPQQAVEAYLTALTYAAPEPPDMGIYDIGLRRIGELDANLADVIDAIPQLANRLDDVEEAFKTLTPATPTAAPKRVNPLLAGRDAAATHAAQPHPPTKPAPPAIRRVPADSAVRVHGSYAGGPMSGRHVAQPEPDLEGDG